MADKELASASFSRVQRKLQTTEEVLAVLLDSEDDSDAVDSYLSDDSSICFDSNADNKDSDTGWQNFSDSAEPCFEDSRFISDVSSNIIILTLSRDMCCFRGIWLYEIKFCLFNEMAALQEAILKFIYQLVTLHARCLIPCCLSF